MIKVGIWGNNLNQGYFLAELFRGLGATARVFVVGTALDQDQHGWWTTDPIDESLVERVAEAPSVGVRGRLHETEGIRRLYARAREYDVLIVREDGPAIFSDLEDVPRVFASQGADLQLWPFWMHVYYSPRALARQFAACFSEAGLNPGGEPGRTRRLWRQAAVLARSWPAFRRMQTRQRLGIRRCDRVIVFPYQKPLLDRLQVSEDRIRYIPVPGPPPGILGNASRTVPDEALARLRAAPAVFLHPTRLFFLREDGNQFLKDNDKLIQAFAQFIGGGAAGHCLALFRKGRPRDIAAADALVEQLGIAPHVVWLPELPNHGLRALFHLPNMVVCDQFSPFLNALGNLGRESVYHGLPLITSYDGVDDVMYTRRPPNVFLGNSVETIVNSMRVVSAMGPSQREQLKSDCAAWYAENLAPVGNAARYLQQCQEALSYRSGSRT